MVRQVEMGLGEISILVNNAGVARPQAMDEITERDWDEVLAVNLKSMFLVTQAVLPEGPLSRNQSQPPLLRPVQPLGFSATRTMFVFGQEAGEPFMSKSSTWPAYRFSTTHRFV
jgi:NAD(P)-dependent dehydrogenase (short-subunit alcohol dehydrogenase family)